MNRATVWQRMSRALLPLTHRPGRAELNVRKADLLRYADDRVREEIDKIENALRVSRVRLPAIVRERLDAILDGSEGEANVDDLVKELVADLLARR